MDLRILRTTHHSVHLNWTAGKLDHQTHTVGRSWSIISLRRITGYQGYSIAAIARHITENTNKITGLSSPAASKNCNRGLEIWGKLQ